MTLDSTVHLLALARFNNGCVHYTLLCKVLLPGLLMRDDEPKQYEPLFHC